MDKIWDFLSNPLFTIFLTVFFGIITIIFYYRSPPKVIKCVILSNQLINNTQSQFSNLNILYGGKQVKKLSVSKITFWNSSFSTITKEDLIKKAPFSVTVNDGEILELSVLGGKDTSNQIGVDFIDDCSAKIYFDYLNHKEGGIIQVIHTGNQKIDISQKLMGGKIIKYTKKIIKLKSILFFLISVIIFGILFVLYMIYCTFELKIKLFLFIILEFFLAIISELFNSIYFNENYIPKNCKNEKKIKKK